MCTLDLDHGYFIGQNQDILILYGVVFVWKLKIDMCSNASSAANDRVKLVVWLVLRLTGGSLLCFDWGVVRLLVVLQCSRER